MSSNLQIGLDKQCKIIYNVFMGKQQQSKKENEMTTTCQDIQANENEGNGDYFESLTQSELGSLRRDLIGDAHDCHSYGSHGEAELIEKDVTEIENILNVPLTFPRWSYLVE